MSRHLVVVESPAKARTLKKYLGQDYQILASYGHVRDLLPKEGAVDPESGFSMKYEVIGKNAKHVDAIAKAVKQADVLYLATDPDREGEAISWHLHEILRERRLLKDKDVRRVVFHEITRGAIQDAVRHPRDLSMELVNAQQARRALDYLVGFSLSPLLWKKIRRGLSAGRVQSPALRMIVEREQEIEAFVRQEYWTVEARASKDGQDFRAKLVQYLGAKVEQFTITRQDQADAAIAALRAAAAGKLRVEQVERKQRRRQPPPPFTTSTLQQEAARKLGFSAERTMRVAQQLYEGVDVGGDRAGLITYMRTDSVNLAQEAVRDIRAYISERFGESRLPARPRLYKTKSKNAQEAHEAIRVTSVQREPQSVKSYLSADQLKLYELVWRRAVACQMMHATIDTVAVDLACGTKESLFRATGSTVADAGYLAVYEEGRDDAQAEDENLPIPPLAVGDLVDLFDILGRQHFTEPPPRYSEATLIKALEEYGIGRPSTYAAIISTLLQREYAVLEKRRFRPTDVGRIVNRFLTQHFAPYVDYEFTAHLEDELDEVSRGEKQWVPLLREFWSPFKRLVDSKEETVTRQEVTHEVLDEPCPKCGSPLSIRLGRHGRFVGCTAYPECNYTRNLDEDKAPSETEVVQGRTCPECGGDLHVKRGRYGRFIGCSNYPRCKHIEPLEKPVDTGVQCPQCLSGTLLRRRSRRGKVFYSCSSYPKCTYAVWNEPVAETCPKCGWPILTIRSTKRRGGELVCPQKECGYAEPLDLRVAAVS
jgi:DNA topoisomerase-1